MISWRLKAVAAVVIGLQSPSAIAGPATDTLGKCLVTKATDADRTALMQWVLSAMATGRAVADVVVVAPAQREELARKGAELFSRLAFKECRPEALAAIRNDGMLSIANGFWALGGVAADGLLSDPNVKAELGSLSTHVDQQQLKGLVREAITGAGGK